jgi:hypothetical protein
MFCSACNQKDPDIDVEMEFNQLPLDSFKSTPECQKCGLRGVGKDEQGTGLLLIYKNYIDRVPATEHFLMFLVNQAQKLKMGY